MPVLSYIDIYYLCKLYFLYFLFYIFVYTTHGVVDDCLCLEDYVDFAHFKHFTQTTHGYTGAEN